MFLTKTYLWVWFNCERTNFYNFDVGQFIMLPTKITYKKKFFFGGGSLNPFKIRYLVVYTLEENKYNFCFKIDKKLHTKHHQIDQKL